ncbi:hypothetical protein KC19_4G197400 [Ceratodon purpureus]|uniref:SAM-dependent MTase RsmB/NOP-type domain-containing protein n=1 Tax=Ceratodon purpureus TaxID=3225 RepID=A0A8T0IBF7_CERPU|nr:hypothetical protein KC19_4G197400 [Ceratodon purpureus]
MGDDGELQPVHNHASYTPRLVWNPRVHDYLSQAYGPQHFAQISQALTRPSIHSCVRVNTLRTTKREVIKRLTEYVLEQQDGNQSAMLRHNNSQQGSSEAADLKEMECTIPSESTSQPDKGPETSSVCFEHDVLENVVMVRGRGPCSINYDAARTEEGVLREVVVSRKCAEAVLRGAHVFVPGVLACSGHIEKDELVAVSVAMERPDGEGGWFVGVTRGTTLSSEHAKSQFKDEERSGWFVGIGRAMMTRASLFRETKGVAVEMVNRVYDLPPFSGLLNGDIFLQNLPSVVAAHVLDPQPGERILDMCAAPGGKTTGIATLMGDKGVVIALDRSHNKVLDIVRLAEEMKLSCIQAIKMDALKSVRVESTPHQVIQNEPIDESTTNTRLTQAGTDDGVVTDFILNEPDNVVQKCSKKHLREESAQDSTEAAGGPKCAAASPVSSTRSNEESTSTKKFKDNGAYASRKAARKEARKLKTGLKKAAEADTPYKKGFAPQSFDRVLLDAPCSALGLRPRLFAGQETLDGLRQHANYQRRLIDQAVQLVRPNGTLVYSTCTLNPGENEGVVRYALDTYPFLSLSPQHPKLGGPGLVGGDDVFDGATYRAWLRKGEEDMVQRFDPVGPRDTIGFFIAKFCVAAH